jgi:hypothetical protein
MMGDHDFARKPSNANKLIKQIYLPESTFNPSMGRVVNIAIALADSGKLSVIVIDRDLYPIYIICKHKAVSKGVQNFRWFGRDQNDRVVPNEAYSLKIDFVSSNGATETYFPAIRTTELFSIRSQYYDRQSAVLSYQLESPSRVHIQAGTAVLDPKTGKRDGPIYRTVVDREPRAAGKIAEYWTGFEQDGDSIFVPDLKDFAVAIAAAPLPENAIITYGNSATTFWEYAKNRSDEPVAQLTRKGGHHSGLMSYEDVSPTIRLKPIGSQWSDQYRSWKIKPGKIVLEAKLQGPSSEHFIKQSGRVYVFSDGVKIQSVPVPTSTTFQINIPSNFLRSGRHAIAVNWATDAGPTAVGAIAVESSLESARK